jgi:hypothetical protein
VVEVMIKTQLAICRTLSTFSTNTFSTKTSKKGQGAKS